MISIQVHDKDFAKLSITSLTSGFAMLRGLVMWKGHPRDFILVHATCGIDCSGMRSHIKSLFDLQSVLLWWLLANNINGNTAVMILGEFMV